MKKFIVISHTHWDREWYMSFTGFRLRLVDLVDRLLEIIEKDKSYIFHLDAQTIVLEDYLELRPQNRQRLVDYITAGNIIVGPWYLQNDFYLTAGEATVRNLQIGSAIAKDFGKCSSVGYAPDQFGNVSQLPQILSGFGIDNFVFGRGFFKFEKEGDEYRQAKLPAEFVWEGADGTRALAVHMKCWYNNAQHIPAEIDLAELLLDINAKNFEGLNVSSYVLLMNGVDHLEAQADVKEIIGTLQDKGYDIIQTSLDDFIAKVKADVEGKEIYTHKGALNKDHDHSLLKGCWSSRIYLKTANVKAQDLLINKLEPIYSYLEANGFVGVYPKNEMEYLWKSLLKNHPHDSICGCSIDSVHRHMEDRFELIAEMGDDLLARGLKNLSLHVNHKFKDDKNYNVTVFNSTERMRSGVVEAEINIPQNENVESFAIYAEDGTNVAYELISKTQKQFDVISPVNLPGILDVDSFVIRFMAENIPAVGFRMYALVVGEKGEVLGCNAAENSVENERYAVSVEGDSLVITDKTSGKSYKNPLLLEDSFDRGDAYVYKKSPDAPRIYKPTAFEFVANSLKSCVKFKFEYDAPECYDFKKLCASEATVKEVVECELVLNKGSDVITLNYNIINKAKDHRLRLMVASGIVGGVISTDSAFDYAVRTDYDSCILTDSNTHNNETFIEISNGASAMAIYTEGQHEVEYTGEYAVLSVLRCTSYINRNTVTFECIGGETWVVPENQCLREVKGRIGISYGIKRAGAELWSNAKFFRNGFISIPNSFDYKKYSGGRFAVQSAELEKLYYVPDKYKDCRLSGEGLLELSGEKVAITCVKRGICGDVVVRLVNLSDEEITETVKANAKIYITPMSEEAAELIGEGQAEITFGAKKIVTIKLVY